MRLGCLAREQPESEDVGIGIAGMREMILAMFSQRDYVRMHDQPVLLTFYHASVQRLDVGFHHLGGVYIYIYIFIFKYINMDR